MDTDEVGIEWAANDLFGQVRVADIGFAGTGIRVDLGVGATDTAQEGANRAVEDAAEIAGCADADVAGDVDRPPPWRGDVDRLDAIRVGDDVGAGLRHRDADTDAGKALLVAINRVFTGKRRFDTSDIHVQFIAAVAHGRY
ncbi:hypothetical protein D3C72_1258750 [compost metagenome]